MTRIAMTNTDRIKVNGTEMYSRRITEIHKIENGTWGGLIDDNDHFTIIGGKQSGGGSKEWFVHARVIGGGYIRVNSAVEAVKLINSI